MPSRTDFAAIECVTLDLDDTLWPVEPTITRAEQALYKWMQQHYPDVTQTYTLDQLTAKRDAMSQQREDIAYDVTQLRVCALRELEKEFNYPASFSETAMSVFRQHRNQVQPFQHCTTVLAFLQQHYTLGAITNGNAQLQEISLGQYFDFVITAQDAGVVKPHRDIFIQASTQANTKLENMLHIGDSPQADVLGALHAGCKAIWFNKKRLPWPGGQTPDQVIHCLSELPQILQSQ